MAVLEYKTGEHKGGFVGFRVVTTAGGAKYLNHYFSINQYGYDRARALAYELDEKWRALAETVKKEKRLSQSHSRTLVNLGVTGLRANILVERKERGGELRSYYAPVFEVKPPGAGKAYKSFRINKLGYKGAWVKAVATFAQFHQLNVAEELSLIAKEPSKDIFLKTLLEHRKSQGHKITKKEIREKLEA